MYYILSHTNLKPAADFAELFRIAKLMLAICKIQATHTHTHTHTEKNALESGLAMRNFDRQLISLN